MHRDEFFENKIPDLGPTVSFSYLEEVICDRPDVQVLMLVVRGFVPYK